MRITIVSPSLAAGGAERAVVLQAEGFRQRGHKVSVVTLAAQASDFFELPAGTKRIALGVTANSRGLAEAIVNNLHRLRALRDAVIASRPAVVIAHIDQVNALTALALRRTGIPLVVTEHCDPTLQNRSRLWDKLCRVGYRRAAKVVSVSKGIDQCLTWLPESKRAVIHNPVVIPPSVDGDSDLPFGFAHNGKLIVAMGRLTYQKGFDLLLQAFAEVATQQSHWHLVILGEGELRNDLEGQRSELGLQGRVHFGGVVANPFSVLRRADLFVMASRFEGFPYALLEAMACGLPVIYTDCPSGPREIIRHEIDGLLVGNGDVAGLAAAMDRLMSSDDDRKRLAASATQVIERFSLDKITNAWEEILYQVVD